MNGRSDQFATHSRDVQEALEIYKTEFEKRHPEKAFNFDSLERVTSIEVLSI